MEELITAYIAWSHSNPIGFRESEIDYVKRFVKYFKKTQLCNQK